MTPLVCTLQSSGSLDSKDLWLPGIYPSYAVEAKGLGLWVEEKEGKAAAGVALGGGVLRRRSLQISSDETMK